MGTHHKSNRDARKKKYAKQFDRTKKNKETHKAMMIRLNEFWPKNKQKGDK